MIKGKKNIRKNQYFEFLEFYWIAQKWARKSKIEKNSPFLT